MVRSYDLIRPDLHAALRRGEIALRDAMADGQRLYEMGSTILHFGKEHDWAYRIRSGWLCRAREIPDGRRQIISVGLPGDLFGIGDALYTTSSGTIACLTRVRVDAVRKDKLLELAAGNPDVALRLLHHVAAEQRRLSYWVLGIGQGTAAERLAAMLLDLRERLHLRGLVRQSSFRLPLTQRQIGDYVGITSVHVNRVLRGLRDSGVISAQRGLVTLRDVQALARIAGPLREH